jgi:DNA-binding NarL/FixJ family response regulator
MERTVVREERFDRAAPIDILLLSEQVIFREGLRKLFEGEPGFNVVGDVSDADQALKVIADVRPDIVIASLSGRLLPRMLRKLQNLTAGSHVRTILLTTTPTIEKAHVVQAQELGVSDILLKETSRQVLFKSVRRVAAGECRSGREPSNDLAERRHRSPIHTNQFGLTQRELEVVQAVVRGDSNRKVACELSITQHTVKRHLANIYGKVGVFSRLQLAVFAMDQRLTAGATAMGEVASAMAWDSRHAVFTAASHRRTPVPSVVSPGF